MTGVIPVPLQTPAEKELDDRLRESCNRVLEKAKEKLDKCPSCGCPLSEDEEKKGPPIPKQEGRPN